MQAFQAMSEKCTTQCVEAGQTAPSDDKQRACVESWKAKDLLSRIKTCETPSWQPF